jgi:hypothetical protein
MSAIYARYRTDPAFREALFAAARRQRNEAIGRFLSAAAAHFSPKRRAHAAGSYLARQG